MDKSEKTEKKKVSNTCCMTRTMTLTASQVRRRLEAVPAHQQFEAQNNGKSFPFLKLSAELRNAIYELCLVTDRKINVSKPTYQQPVKWRGAHYATILYGPLAGKSWTVTPVLVYPNLLVTCKAINEEATPMLYGSNQFSLQPDFHMNTHLSWLDNPSDLLWTECIGSSVKHIRKIEVRDAAKQSHIIDLLEALKAAKHLETLSVRFSENFRTSKTMAKALYPLILELHRSRKSTDQKAALDVLDFNDKKSSTSSTVDMDEVKGIIEKRLTAFDRASSRKK
jgi:hypothetical protein